MDFSLGFAAFVSSSGCSAGATFANLGLADFAFADLVLCDLVFFDCVFATMIIPLDLVLKAHRHPTDLTSPTPRAGQVHAALIEPDCT